MHVALIGDSHFDASPGGRFEECVRVHDWIAEDLAQQGVDLVLHSGDVFERKSTPEERNAVRAWVAKVAEIAPMVIVRGNHDAPHDLDIFGHLQTSRRVIVEERCGVHEIGGCIVGCLAWPTKASVLAMAREASKEQAEQLAGEALRNVVLGLGARMFELDHVDRPRILLSHAMVRGSRVSTGQPLVGCDLEVGLEDLRLADANAYALGHIHCGQSWCPDGSREANSLDGLAVYPGSPRRTAYGELEEKRYVLLDFGTDGTLQDVGFVPTPCAPMVLLEDEWVELDSGGRCTWSVQYPHTAALELAKLQGAEVRFRYTVEASQREVAKVAAEEAKVRMLAAGAVDVKVEERLRPATKAKAPEVARATTLEAKLRAAWEARDQVPEEPVATRLLGKAADLERQVSL